MDHLETDLKKEVIAGRGLIDLIFSWSVKDVLNAGLYRNQVTKIPETFSSVTSYLKSFVPSLCEETHADLLSNIMTISQVPTCEVLAVTISKKHKPPKDFFYDIVIKGSWDRAGNFAGTYLPLVGDLIALTDTRPKRIDHLSGPRNSYVIAYVFRSTENRISILSSKPISREGDMQNRSKRDTLFAACLMNLTTNVRVWKALTSNGTNTNLISSVLQVQPSSSDHGGNSCTICFSKNICSSALSSTTWSTTCSDLNDSQKAAVSNSISLSKCNHQNTIKLIWGPPGTGKTMTVATSLFALFKLKCRVLVCAPTNIAVLGVAERLLRLVNQSFGYGKYGLGDIILFGNKERMKIDDHDDLVDVFLDYRTEVLANCFASSSGWKHRLKSMISLLKDPAQHYSLYAKNDDKDDLLSFEDFVKQKFELFGKNLLNCMVNLYTHLPTSCMPVKVAKEMVKASDLINSSNSLLRLLGFSNERSQSVLTDCVRVLKSLRAFSVPDVHGMWKIREYCLKNACLIFCTVSSSSKLHTKEMTPLEILIIDEAAQLKECESAIPLQLPGLRHAILIGDQRQLPAMVKSKISEKAGFGRSLFERLVQLGHEKLLLNVQYRMHPSISRFPNREFYNNHILDGPNVIQRSSGMCLLPGKMYGSYSFINIAHGKEELDRGQSQMNMVEVAVVYEIVSSLYREFTRTKKKVSVGVISPYKAQVQAIEERVRKYSEVSDTDFSVSVRSVDGFQGGEADVIIISTVRCNEKGNVGFLSNRQRANVMLTRARHCLWILGSGSTLINSNSIWTKVTSDAKKRKCFYNADEDKSLAQAIAASLLKLGQLSVLLNVDSFLFRNAKWKVCFTSEFLKSMQKIKDTKIREEVVSLLAKLANGWRQGQKDKQHIGHGGASAQWLQKYAVKRLLNLVWSVDVVEESSSSLQVIKVWDLLRVSDTPKLAKRLHMIFQSYPAAKMNLCQLGCVDGGIVVPMRWPVDKSSSCETETDPVDLLAKPLSSLTLTDKPETSSTATYSKSKRWGKKA